MTVTESQAGTENKDEDGEAVLFGEVLDRMGGMVLAVKEYFDQFVAPVNDANEDTGADQESYAVSADRSPLSTLITNVTATISNTIDDEDPLTVLSPSLTTLHITTGSQVLLRTAGQTFSCKTIT